MPAWWQAVCDRPEISPSARMRAEELGLDSTECTSWEDTGQVHKSFPGLPDRKLYIGFLNVWPDQATSQHAWGWQAQLASS